MRNTKNPAWLLPAGVTHVKDSPDQKYTFLYSRDVAFSKRKRVQLKENLTGKVILRRKAIKMYSAWSVVINFYLASTTMERCHWSKHVQYWGGREFDSGDPTF